MKFCPIEVTSPDQGLYTSKKSWEKIYVFLKIRLDPGIFLKLTWSDQSDKRFLWLSKLSSIWEKQVNEVAATVSSSHLQCFYFQSYCPLYIHALTFCGLWQILITCIVFEAFQEFLGQMLYFKLVKHEKLSEMLR